MYIDYVFANCLSDSVDFQAGAGGCFKDEKKTRIVEESRKKAK
jgi:hypothetical protein